MDPRTSPYSPGAGTRPIALVGREAALEDFKVTLDRLQNGRSATAPLLTGSRGSGKTVLLNELVRIARERGWFTAVEEINEESRLADVIAVLARDVLLEMSAKKRLANRVQRALGVLKAFTSVSALGIKVTIDVAAVSGPADSGDLARDLRGLFVELGKLARDLDVGVLFALDEMHVLGENSFEVLHSALHRTAQENLPVALVGCGLFPSWQSGLEAQRPSVGPSSYIPRMYVASYVRLLPLSDDKARDALTIPAEQEGVRFTDEALFAAVSFCEGNPWLLQLLGSAAWEEADDSPIEYDDVARAAERTQDQLDDWFFPRILRACDGRGREFLLAMARRPEADVPFVALSASLEEPTPRKLVARAVQLAQQDIVAINYSRRVDVAGDTVTFTVPRLRDYLQRNEFLIAASAAEPE